MEYATAMPLPRTSQDPEGHYARLGVAPSAPSDTIVAAWRREARLVHPDVPRTGDAAAFVALKRAYDVLIDPDSRAAYDRSAIPKPRRFDDREPGEIGAMPFPDIAAPRTRHPRLTDLPGWVWAGMAIMLAVGLIEVGLHLNAPPPPARRETVPATARDVPPAPPAEVPHGTYGTAPVRLAGTPNFYIMPTANTAMLWRADEEKHTFVPWGQLPAFSAVQAVRLIKAAGMVEVKVTDTVNGFVEAGRLTPGDAGAATRAWCTFHAGPPPANGEILSRGAEGKAALSLRNRSGQPVVVKLRAADGSVVASVFMAPGGQVSMPGLPEQSTRLDFATGEVWSRACHGFAAGMRAQSLTAPVMVGQLAEIAIPPERGATVDELSDQAFERQ